MATAYMTLPCSGTKYSRTAWPRHVESCEYCKRELNELLYGNKYDEKISEFLRSFENPFRDFTVRFSEFPGLFPIYGKKISDQVMHVLYENKRHLFPKEWKYECICGKRFPNSTTFGAHVLKCEEIEKFRKKLNEKYFSLEKLKEELEEAKKPVLTYVEECLEKEGIQQKHIQGNIYRYLSSLVDKYVKEKKLNYTKVSTKDLMRNKHVKRRVQNTIKEKYGVDNISQLSETKDKKKLTTLKNYGVTHHMKLDSMKRRVKRTVLEKYGVENVSQLEDVKKKKEETFIKHYGVDNIFKRVDIMTRFWKKNLYINNPMFLKEDISEDFKKYSVDICIGGRLFSILSKAEEYILKFYFKNLSRWKSFSKTSIRANRDLIIDSDKSSVYLVDILVNERYPIECSAHSSRADFTDSTFIKRKEISIKKFGNFVYFTTTETLSRSTIYMFLKNRKPKCFYMSPIFSKMRNIIEQDSKLYGYKVISLYEMGVKTFSDSVLFLFDVLNDHYSKTYTKKFVETSNLSNDFRIHNIQEKNIDMSVFDIFN